MAARALREQWTDELSSMFRAVTRPRRDAGPATGDVLTALPAVVPMPDTGDVEESEALSASERGRVQETITTAGAMFRSARDKVQAAEAELEAARQASAEQIQAKQLEIAALEERLSSCRDKFNHLLEQEGRKVLAAQAEAETAAEFARSWEERALQAEAEAEQKADELTAAVFAVRKKLFAAETRAQEAQDDLEYFRQMTLESFGVDAIQEAAATA